MRLSKKGESLASIIVGVFILSIVALGIGNLLGSSRELIDKHNIITEINFLKKNTYIIVNKLDLSSLNDGDIFYIYKNNSSKKFEIKNLEEYKYINKFGEKVDISSKKNIFIREMLMNKKNINGEEYISINYNIKKYEK